ncbi:alpha/beta-hydrolase [Ascoidea rubescens DSM 1968]|uniref:Alpha/beta-hydrolase n=1 Tax=Ascoidea rubescens DSM 1968 TaxID=1344418 RepID=A0A1D2V8Z8_9ASCO|nr:alpha/beta-hydrolase [Ascoidea rubescens DSM 1968]ODV58120.1 alpha/beta-hydrolase [Ascoidea rubescens DSM 1968]
MSSVATNNTPVQIHNIEFSYADAFKYWWNSSFRTLRKYEKDLLESNLSFYPISDDKKITGKLIDTKIDDHDNYIHEFYIENNEKDLKNLKNEDKHVIFIHGYGASLGFYFKNFQDFSKIPGIKLHAIDLLGFGLSSRPRFPRKQKEKIDDIDRSQDYFLSSFESWRKAKKIDNFVLVAHSLGGYLGFLYSLKYPEHIDKLVLISPVGVERNYYSIRENLANNEINNHLKNTILDKLAPRKVKMEDVVPNDNQVEFDHELQTNRLLSIPTWLRISWERSLVSPFDILRAMGPLSPHFALKWSRRRFSQTFNNTKDFITMHNYVYYSLLVGKPSGEYSVARLLAPVAVAYYPLLDRIPKASKIDKNKKSLFTNIPSLWLYGDEDWMNKDAGNLIVNEINKVHSQLDLEGKSSSDHLSQFKIISKAGHHVYFDNPADFKDAFLEFSGW